MLHGRPHCLAVLLVLAPFLPAVAVCKSGTATEGDAPTALTAAITPQLRQELEAAVKAKGLNYEPRTRHFLADGAPKYTNRLAKESSPYLLQHAHNPVNWFPWGDEAFQLAKALNRPVFLSVGYSTCHWCHVMEEESFEDEAIAEYLNQNYIPVKVDREERPDVDSVYMSAVHAMRGRGGWPMSVWLTPDRLPFFGGTYFPPRDGVRGAQKGFATLLREQAERYRRSPDSVAEMATRLADAVKEQGQPSTKGASVDGAVLELSASQAKRRFDPVWGGVRGRHQRSPKFPSSFPVRSLLRQSQRSGDGDAREMALKTLKMMSRGGMYDHVGGGFHRYSTDQQWLVPHFEKMLYDNALLAVTYLEGFQASQDRDFARVARETLDYVAREMRAPSGGFYSATDADSVGPEGHREEGYYFTWTPEEMEAVLGKNGARVVSAYYNVTPTGNFERSGRTILHTPRSRDEVAKELSMTREALDKTLATAIPLLRKDREKRPSPLRDDKIQTNWNGLMISAFARGARVLGDPSYLAVAEKAGDTLFAQHRLHGRVRHTEKDGQLSEFGFADDLAFLAAGYLDLFEATSEPKWLERAVLLMDELESFYADEQQGGYFLTAVDGEELLVREKPSRDGALPSANSVAAMNQARLSELTTDDVWRARAERTLRAFSQTLARFPSSLDVMLLAVDFRQGTTKEVALVVAEGDPSRAKAFLDVLNGHFVPNHVLVVASAEALNGRLGSWTPWAAGKPPKKGRTTAYVCERGACELPTTDPEVFAKQVGARR